MAAGIRVERNVAWALKPYIIAEALPLVVAMLQREGVRVAFSTRKGHTLGYYMPPKVDADTPAFVSGFAKLHTISLQIDLNPYALLFVFVHEWAHLLTQKQYGNNVYPHGKEWKKNFKTLFKPFFSPRIFPNDILQVIAGYFEKTSRYFEADLEEACNRYGRNRKAFVSKYMKLLRKGVVIPAPDLGTAAQKLLAGIREQETEAERAREEAAFQALEQRRKEAEEPPVEVWVEAGSLRINELPVGARLRMEGCDYEVTEKLPPFVNVRKLTDGQKLRVHGLVAVHRLERNPLAE
ncbi:MAG: hypothetical protein NC396_03910 [Bacteroides sp.]|nr:hypothetical protein [Bacteroides sp.]MCM1085371.1 hypothetical protein [Bacteroides sp.]